MSSYVSTTQVTTRVNLKTVSMIAVVVGFVGVVWHVAKWATSSHKSKPSNRGL